MPVTTNPPSMGRWSCSKCGKQNPGGSDTCDMCSSFRPSENDPPRALHPGQNQKKTFSASPRGETIRSSATDVRGTESKTMGGVERSRERRTGADLKGFTSGTGARAAERENGTASSSDTKGFTSGTGVCPVRRESGTSSSADFAGFMSGTGARAAEGENGTASSADPKGFMSGTGARAAERENGTASSADPKGFMSGSGVRSAERENGTALSADVATAAAAPPRVMEPSDECMESSGPSTAQSSAAIDEDIWCVENTKTTSAVAAAPPPRRRKAKPPVSPSMDIDPQRLKRTSPSATLWVDKYAPNAVEDLALLDPNRVEATREVLERALKNTGPRLIVLHGPVGCGKTALVRVLAREMELQIREWDSEKLYANTYSDPEIPYENRLASISQVKDLERFLSQATAKGLKLKNKFVAKIDAAVSSAGTIILLENLPSHFSDRHRSSHSESSKVHALIEVCVNRLETLTALKTVVVFIYSSEGDVSASDAQLKEAVGEIALGKAKTIAFNPIPEGRMKKYLTKIAKAEGYDLNLASTEAKIGRGDIRSALNNLQFACLANNMPSRTRLKINGAVAATTVTTTVTNQRSDIRYDMLHGVGKLIRGKKIGTPSFDPEHIARLCCLEPDALSLFVHENFHKYASVCVERNTVELYFRFLDTLTLADQVISSKWRVLEKSGGEDEVDSSDAYAESLVSRVASCWAYLPKDQPRVSQFSTRSMIAVTKPEGFKIQRDARERLDRTLKYLRNQGQCGSTQRFLYEILPFSCKIVSSQDLLAGSSQFNSKMLPTRDFRRVLEEDEDQLPPSMLLDEDIED